MVHHSESEWIDILPLNDQKDLGIKVCNTLTPNKHIQDIVKKAHQKIAMFRRCFTGFDEEKVTILYKSLIRPSLEYASAAWSPLTKENINELEKVQRRYLRLCKEDICMESLQERRLKTDLVETYNINGLCKTPVDKFFSLALPHKDLRGHSKNHYLSDVLKPN